MCARRFGTAGIRGVINAEITPELAVRLARAYGDWIGENRRRRGSACVGHDTRWGAAMLAGAAAAGFASSGLDVRHLGLVSTGAFSINVARAGCDGGFLVTGSHMPPERTGLLLTTGDGAIAPYSLTDQVEAIMAAENPRKVPPDMIGSIREADDPWDVYLSETERALDAPLIRSGKFRVTVDAANGAACPAAGEFFRRLGCAVETLNDTPSPVPARPSEPRAGNVAEARRRVVESRSDLGVCLDVDADRALFIDGRGNPIPEDTVGAVLAGSVLSPGDVCVVPVNSSGLIEHVCRAAGARLEYCRIGQPDTIQAIRDHGAAFSYEECGKYWFARRFLWSDGLYTAARLLQLMARTGRRAGELAAGLPSFHQARRNVALDGRCGAAVMRALEERLRSRLTDGRLRDVTLDGFKRIFKDDSWLMFRMSGTEPLFRIYSDAPSRERAERLAAAGESLLRECM